jgi:rhodanese-related sulfurtransferase
VRRGKAQNFLQQQGFKYLKSVKGGITAWSEEIGSKVPRY